MFKSDFKFSVKTDLSKRYYESKYDRHQFYIKRRQIFLIKKFSDKEINVWHFPSEPGGNKTVSCAAGFGVCCVCKSNNQFIIAIYECSYDLNSPVHNVLDACISIMRASGRGEIESFLSPVKWHRVDRGVPFGGPKNFATWFSELYNRILEYRYSDTHGKLNRRLCSLTSSDDY